ncbi:Uncharacterised protein [Stutzerimonas stutzeri]|nr:Uncharacterised protein [Stutzerimonas stutzeri]
MRELLPIKTLFVTLALEEYDVPRLSPKNTELVIFPLLNELQVAKILVLPTRVLDKVTVLPKIADRSARLLVEPENCIALPIIGVISNWALFKLIFVPITGELLAVVPHNKSICPITGEKVAVVVHNESVCPMSGEEVTLVEHVLIL